MLFSATPIGRYQVVFAISLVLALDDYSSTIKLTAATLVTPQKIFGWTWLTPSQRQLHQNDERDQEAQTRRELLGYATQPWHHNIIVKTIRGGGNNAKTGSTQKEGELLSSIDGMEKGSSKRHDESTRDDVACSKSTVITIGVVDLSRIESNMPSLYSSIVLVVGDDTRKDGMPIDEILLQRNNHFLLFQDKEMNASIEVFSEEMEDDTNAILESLALLCDILVVRIGEGETLAPELMSCVISGNRQRESTGMAGGKHWLTKGPDDVLRRLNGDKANYENDDNYCHSSTTTWSTLFSPWKGEKENDNLKEIFTSLSQQTILSKRHSMMKLKGATTSKASGNKFGDPFPPVSVLCMNKERGNDALQDDKILFAKTTQTSSRFNKVAEVNKSERTYQQQENDEIVGNVIGMAFRRLEELEEKMQELILDQSSNRMPLLEFGSLVQDILHTADMQLKDESMNDAFRRGLMKGIVVEVQRLYKDQLQALRNYYGQRYESILDEKVEEDNDNDEIIEHRWAAGAEHMTQAFSAAARNSVPSTYQIDLKDAKGKTKSKNEASFDHVDALQGLIQDMIESTERRKDELNVATILKADDEETLDSASTSAWRVRLTKLPKWLERLAARAIVFGVNYVQGWLAWQGIKRAALSRDRNQPKFPLF